MGVLENRDRVCAPYKHVLYERRHTYGDRVMYIVTVTARIQVQPCDVKRHGFKEAPTGECTSGAIKVKCLLPLKSCTVFVQVLTVVGFLTIPLL